ncbi:MAG: hypothetical protein ACK4YP_01575 [Myxococcota bacterium]
MSLFLISLALAAEIPPEPPPADAPWHIAADALPDVADPTGVEAIFHRYGVDTDDTALVSAASYAPSPTRRRVRVRRENLGNGDVSERLDLRPVRNCAAAGDAWGTGALRLHTVAAPEAPAPDPAMVLVKDNPRIGSLVIMLPGDTVEIREVRRNGRLVTKSVVVHRRAERLELRRAGDRAWICSARNVRFARAPGEGAAG